MSASLKIRQLESKISDLQSQHQILLKERQQEIAVLFSTVDLAHLDDKILLGYLLFLKDKITTQDRMLEAWHDAGEKFLRRSKPKTRPEKGEEQAGNYPRPHAIQQAKDPRISSKKSVPPKQTPPPPATHQSAEKQTQSREV